MDFGVGPTRADINLKVAPVERTMAGDARGGSVRAQSRSGPCVEEAEFLLFARLGLGYACPCKYEDS